MSNPLNISQGVLQSIILERLQQAQQNTETQQSYFEHQLSRESIKTQHRVNKFEGMDYTQLKNKEERKREKDPQKDGKNRKSIDTDTSINNEHPVKIDIKA